MINVKVVKMITYHFFDAKHKGFDECKTEKNVCCIKVYSYVPWILTCKQDYKNKTNINESTLLEMGGFHKIQFNSTLQ